VTDSASSSPQARPPRRPSAERRAAGQPPAPPANDQRQHLTSRAAILAIVLCAIALSLAYPVREYLAQRRLIDQLRVHGAALAATEKRLRAEQRQLANPAYIERLARDRLHMCAPGQRCYVIIGPGPRRAVAPAPGQSPWYARLWASVRQANTAPAPKHAQATGQNGQHAHPRRQ
jgi:cell division protein FtsB